MYNYIDVNSLFKGTPLPSGRVIHTDFSKFSKTFIFLSTMILRHQNLSCGTIPH